MRGFLLSFIWVARPSDSLQADRALSRISDLTSAFRSGCPNSCAEALRE